MSAPSPAEAQERERLLAELEQVVLERDALRQEKARLTAELARVRAGRDPGLESTRRRKAKGG